MIPVSSNLNIALRANKNGNFSLWFNKFIAIDENTGKPQGNEAAIERILAHYNNLHTSEIYALLGNKHKNQEALAQYFSNKYIYISFRAQLISRLITGLGQTHPTGTGLILDHNLGIPYIPAASIKGLVRASRRILLGFNDEKRDEDETTLIPIIFGGQSKVGKVIFLDSYPENVPTLEMDIMTPHYSDYYNGNDWPGDWMDPTPIKFLAVAKDTVFIFRALVEKTENKKSNGELLKAVKEALENALTVEGIGAKTAVGYGRFKILPNQNIRQNSSEKESKPELNFYDLIPGNKDSYLERIKIAAPESDKIQWLFQKWQNDPLLKSDKDIARAFLTKIKKHKKKGNETSFYKILKNILNIS